jgi:hypothetical protein
MEIEDEDLLYRRLARHQVNPDGTVNSSAFKRGKGYDHEISVDVARLTSRQESIDRAPRAGFQLGEVTAKHPRELGFGVVHSPLAGNPSHALITGTNDQALSRALARKVHLIPRIESRDHPT